MTESAFEVARLDGMKGQPVGGRARLDVRRELGIRAFGTAAFRLLEPGDVIRDHEEASLRVGQSGQEELYVVVAGRATFEVDGERVEAPQGTLVFVRDPVARRRAVAEEPGTTVLVIGGKPGEAFYPLPAEAYEASAAYNAGHFERALELYEGLLGTGLPSEAVLLLQPRLLRVVARADRCCARAIARCSGGRRTRARAGANGYRLRFDSG